MKDNIDKLKQKLSEQAQSITRNNTGANSGNDVGGDSTTNTADDMTNNLQQKSKQVTDKAKDMAKRKMKENIKKAVQKSAQTGAKAGAQAGTSAATGAATTAGSTAAGTASAGAASAGASAGAAAGSSAAAGAGAAAGSAAASSGTAVAATPVGWIILAAVLIIVLVVAVFYWSMDKNEKKQKTDYIIYNGQTINLEADWTDRLTYSYYMAVADRGYYYTVDNDTTIKQAGEKNNDVIDKYARESSFAMNVELIKFLDEELNEGFSMPEQFIKPVYNTCSTGESTDGYCKTKPLSNEDGELVVKSQGYIELEGCNEDKTLCGLYYKEDSNQSSIDKTETVSVSSWGLAPILHYKKYTEKRWAQNLQVSNVKYYDKKTEEYKECKYKECPEDIKKKITEKTKTNNVDENGKVSGDKINNYKVNSGKVDETSKQVYLIDSVATSVGTVSNEVEEVTEATGEKFSNDVVVTEQDLKIAKDVNSKYVKDTEYEKNAYVRIAATVKKRFSDKDYWALKQKAGPQFIFGNMMTNQEFGFNFGKLDLSKYNEDDVTVEVDGSYLKITSTEIDEPFQNCKTLTVTDSKKASDDSDLVFTCTKEDGTKVTVNAGDEKYRSFSLDGYTFNDSTDIITITASLMYDDGTQDKKNGIKCTKTYNTIYTITGDYWSTEYKYKSNAPKTKDIDEGQYIKDYIKNYEVYYSNKDWDEDFEELTFEQIYKSSLAKAENIVGDIDEAENIEYKSDYAKILLQLYGDKIFLDKEAYIQSKIIEIDNGQTGTESMSGLPLGELSGDVNTCLNRLRSYSTPTGNAYTSLLRYSNYYGMDPYLMIAVGLQEGSCDTGKWNVSVENTSTPAYGMFQMEKSVWWGKEISSFNYETNQTDTLKLNKSGAETNIQFAVMNMANLVKKYNGNILLALQAYNFGSGAMGVVIDNYAKASGIDSSSVYSEKNYYDLGWLGYRETYKKGYGDSKYIEHVLRYIPASKAIMSIKRDSATTISYNIAQAASGYVTSAADTGRNISDYVYWYKNKTVILNNWTKLFPFKNKNAIEYTVKNKEFPVNGISRSTVFDTYYRFKPNSNASENSINKTLAEFLAALDGSSPSENLELTSIQWKQKFAALFTAEAGTVVEAELPDFTSYFGEQPALPIDNVYIASRKYGKTIDEEGDITSRTDIGIKTSKDAKVKAVSKGVIEDISNDCIVIDHTDDNRKEGHTIYTSYCQVKVDDKWKVGDSVKRSDILGTANGDLSNNEGEEIPGISFTLEIDGTYENPELLLRYIQLTIQYEYSLNSSSLKLATNELTKKFNAYVDANMTEVEQFLNDNPVDIFDNGLGKSLSIPMHMTSNFGWRNLGSGQEFHGAIDVVAANWGGCTDGAKFCNHIFAQGAGVVVSAVDGIKDTVGSDLSNITGGNYTLMLYKGTDGNLYTVLYYHLAQGSVVRAFDGLENPMIPEGGLIGTQGNSGRTTGTHIHIEVINYGDMSLSEFFTHVRKYGIMGGLKYASAGSHCDNTSNKPCLMNPASVFGYSGGAYQNTVVNNNKKDISRVTNSLPKNAVGLGG